MLTASKLPGGFGKDIRFEVAASGSAIGIINDTRMTIELDGRSFSVTRHGFVGPIRELKSGETSIATTTQKPFVNNYTLSFGGKEWTFKATNWSATKFGLFDNGKQTGAISSGSFLSRLKNITADLPDELPREVQVFLLALFISRLMTSST